MVQFFDDSFSVFNYSEIGRKVGRLLGFDICTTSVIGISTIGDMLPFSSTPFACLRLGIRFSALPHNRRLSNPDVLFGPQLSVLNHTKIRFFSRFSLTVVLPIEGKNGRPSAGVIPPGRRSAAAAPAVSQPTHSRPPTLKSAKLAFVPACGRRSRPQTRSTSHAIDPPAAQIAMFPAMVNPVLNGEDGPRPENSIQPFIDQWAAVPGVLAWKMPGAGGGGYLALVVTDSASFAADHPEAIELHIRRK